MPNRLASAMSPYLRSHAENPVDWFEWGHEAFAEAERRDVPVLISIGYSTCHWCHVMARESFSDPQLAAQLNEGFVAIKVDREEYPDVDASYLAAASAFTEQLGWPLNVFVTPQGGPFFAGTYWPPEPVAGQPAFRDVLAAVGDAWRSNRDAVDANAAGITATLASYTRPAEVGADIDIAAVVAELETYEDAEFGGFGTAPKFPVATVLGFALDAGAEGLARRTLAAMAASDLRDPVEGGFFRYATRRDWSEPHYERMLYDNALLLDCYARIGDTDTAAGIVRFLVERVRLPGGAFASAQDSESMIDGARVEGGYYALDAEGRAALTPPALDEKVLTGWNGLAIESLARAGFVGEARACADYLIEHHVEERLVRASIDGVPSAAPATLEDFGMLAGGLLELGLSTGEVRYLSIARQLVDDCLAGSPTLDFVVPGGPEPLLAHLGLALESDPSEGAYPSGVSALAGAAHRLWLLTGDSRYRAAAERALASIAPLAANRPMSFGAALGVIVALRADAIQLVVVADGPSELADVARAWRHPGGIATVVTSAQARVLESAGFELYAGRIAVDGRATAYACREFACELPVHDAAHLSFSQHPA